VIEKEQANHELSRMATMNAVMNVILSVGKGVIGILAGSQALIADAIHSAADVVGSLAVIIGLRIARKPPDRDHPYGHGKAEIIASSIVSGFLLAAGLDVGYTSVEALFHAPAVPNITAAFAAFVAMLIKEVLYHYNYRLGQKYSSKSLIASAYDHRSDVFSSLAALIGIILSLVGRHFHFHWLLYMDKIAGAFVALLILKITIHIAKDSLQTLMDRVVLAEDQLTPYRTDILRVPGVREIDELRVRDHGQYVIVDVEISVDADISVASGHDIATDVKKQMVDTFERVQDVFVHVNPFYANPLSCSTNHREKETS
jgi:cation diffusion facilitator family transporter